MNLTDEMSALTLDIVLRSIFGRDLERMSHGARRQSVRCGHQGAGPEPAVRFQVSLAHQARRRAPRAAPPRGRRALRLHRDAHERARQGQRRADGRAPAHRRGPDARGGGPRDDRERAQLDLVPAVPASRRRGPAARGARCRPGTVRAEPGADGAAGVHPAGHQRGAAALSAGVAPVAAHRAARCAFRV